MRTELINAIATEEFFIQIQPIIDMSNDKICGGEVLARWLNLYFDNISPDIFIPLAEKMGMMKKFDMYILSLAVDFIQNTKLDDSIFINVNFSGEQFNSHDFIDILTEYVKRYPKLKKHLVVEITESTMINNVSLTSEYISSIKGLGLRIAIDDFGTGFSSLAYLKHFAIDFLKIDISFIEHIEDNTTDRAITQTIIDLAKAIGAKTIVEGVERETQYNIVKEMGADYVQGFYCDKPLYKEEFALKV